MKKNLSLVFAILCSNSLIQNGGVMELSSRIKSTVSYLMLYELLCISILINSECCFNVLPPWFCQKERSWKCEYWRPSSILERNTTSKQKVILHVFTYALIFKNFLEEGGGLWIRQYVMVTSFAKIFPPLLKKVNYVDNKT